MGRVKRGGYVYDVRLLDLVRTGTLWGCLGTVSGNQNQNVHRLAWLNIADSVHVSTNSRRYANHKSIRITSVDIPTRAHDQNPNQHANYQPNDRQYDGVPKVWHLREIRPCQLLRSRWYLVPELRRSRQQKCEAQVD